MCGFKGPLEQREWVVEGPFWQMAQDSTQARADSVTLGRRLQVLILSLLICVGRTVMKG